MNHLYAAILISDGVLGFYFAFNNLTYKDRKLDSRIQLFLLGLCSALWSFGFGMLYLSQSTQRAYQMRCIGLFGVFAYLIIAFLFLERITKFPKKHGIIIHLISLSGVAIFFGVIRADQVSFSIEEGWGMTYTLKSTVINNLYSLYTILMAVALLVNILYLKRTAKNHRQFALVKDLFLTLCLLVFGSFLDTIFPMFGYKAIPGSSICQFFAYLVLLRAIANREKTYATLSNMSDFMYYSVSSPILVYDVHGTLRLFNKGSEDFFGITRQQAIDLNFGPKEFFQLPDFNFNNLDLEKTSIQTVCRTNDLDCIISVDKVRDKFNDVISYVVMVDDISKQIEMMKELEEANKAKSIFLANMSHEIRTPMNAIIGFSEILLNEQMPESQKQKVANIRDSSYSLLSLINDILDFSKIESGKMELVEAPYSTSDLLRDALLQVKDAAQNKNLELQLEISPTLPTKLLGDENKIREVLVNTLNNSIKYTNEGFVKLTVQEYFDSDRIATLSISVKDSGVGISESNQKIIFNAFEQVNNKVHAGIEGTGLGLSIVRGYIDLMHGTIGVKSQPGAGTTISYKFPQIIVDETPLGDFSLESDALAHSNIGTLDLNGVNILCVDDNPLNLSVIESTLATYNATVFTAISGARAIKMCQNKEFAIIFMDQMMPEMDGLEAMKKIRQLSDFYKNNCSIIALTANAISGTREQLMAEGFDEYLTKPIDYDQLKLVLSETCSGL